jgi:ribonuclease P protein component
MLPKKNRVDTKQMEEIFKRGKFVSSSNLTFKFVIGGSLFPRISFIAPKNIAKLAVKRNLLRRRGYSASEKYIHRFPSGLSGVFVFKKPISSVLEIENEIKTILNKIN